MSIVAIIIITIFVFLCGTILGFITSALATSSTVNEYRERYCFIKEEMKKYDELSEILEKVYKCPAIILDREEALNNIMLKYKEIRK